MAEYDLPPQMEPVEFVVLDGMRLYPDGEKVPSELPDAYQSQYKEGVTEGQACHNCEYFYMGHCHAWEAMARSSYWCAKWEPYIEDDSYSPMRVLENQEPVITRRRPSVYHLRTYSYKCDAKKASERIGCEIGAHRAVDGRWSPCLSQSELVTALRKK